MLLVSIVSFSSIKAYGRQQITCLHSIDECVRIKMQDEEGEETIVIFSGTYYEQIQIL